MYRFEFHFGNRVEYSETFHSTFGLKNIFDTRVREARKCGSFKYAFCVDLETGEIIFSGR